MKLNNETLSKNFLIYGFGKSGISSLKYLKKYFKKEVENLETLNIDTSKWRDY
mgnify:CR=1 FL=1